MKFSGSRWLFVVAVAGAGLAGVISSNVGCGGDSDGKAGTSGSSGGGSTGSAGTSGGGSGGQKPLKLSYTFDTSGSSDSTMWKLNDYIDASPAKNLGAYSKPDAGLNLGADAPVMEWAMDDSESSTTSGSVAIARSIADCGSWAVSTLKPLRLSSVPIASAHR